MYDKKLNVNICYVAAHSKSSLWLEDINSGHKMQRNTVGLQKTPVNYSNMLSGNVLFYQTNWPTWLWYAQTHTAEYPMEIYPEGPYIKIMQWNGDTCLDIIYGLAVFILPAFIIKYVQN